MNLSQTQIPIWRTTLAAYRLGLGALFRDGALFRYFLYASLLSLVVYGGQFYLVTTDLAAPDDPPSSGQQTLRLILSLLGYVALAWVQTPLGVAVHRKILLGETPTLPYLSAALAPVQRRFFVAAVDVYAMFVLASLVQFPVTYLIYGANPLDPVAVRHAFELHATMGPVTTLLTILAYLLAGLIATRCAFAFPAIALDEPGASLRQSLAQTRGTAARLFFLFLTIYALPAIAFIICIFIASIAVVAINVGQGLAPEEAGRALMTSTPFLILYAMMFIAVMTLTVITAAAAARAYDIRIGRGMRQLADVFS